MRAVAFAMDTEPMTDAATAAPTRRLAAVLLADVAGYSRLMERDDAGTHERLRQIRAGIIDPALERYRGRAVRSKGDDLLIEFASAADAFACAVDIQRALHQRNASAAAATRMHLRIGINLGDILIDGEDIAGDGVNVAARLQGLAEPGGIAISSAVREQIRGTAGLRVADVGEVRVKNISRPIRVFQVYVGEAAPSWRVRWHAALSQQPRWLRVLWAALAASAATMLLLTWSRPPPPPLLSLGVLPAVDGTRSAKGAAIAQDLSQRVVELALPHLGPTGRVVPIATEAARMSDNDLDALGKSANVRYIATLRVVEAGDRQRVAADLTDTQTRARVWSGSVWAEHTVGEPASLELLARLSYSLSAQVREAELLRWGDRPSDDPEVALLRAQQYYDESETTEAALREAARRFAEVSALSPRLARALSGEAESLALLVRRSNDGVAARAALARADELSLRAMSLAPTDPEVWRVRSVALAQQGALLPATEAIDRALQLNPVSSEAHAQRGMLLMSQADLAGALAAFDRAIRLAPTSSSVGANLHYRGRVFLLMGRYDEAVESVTRAIAFWPEWPDYALLAAAYAMQGNRERAAWARQELLRLEPNFTIDWYRARAPELGAAAAPLAERHLYAGLRRAGLPD